jgi:tRNA-guanine family transglycosylase
MFDFTGGLSLKVFLSWYADPPDPPYWLWIKELDGIVVSLHSLIKRKTLLDAVTLRGLRRFIGCDKTIIVDSLPFSLFSNLNSHVEPLQSWILYTQRLLGADILVHRDIPLINASENVRDKLLRRTMLNAEHALRVAEKLGIDIMLVAQGWDIDSYTMCARYYRDLGAKYVAIGSLVPKRGNTEFVKKVTKRVREILGRSAHLHLLGIANLSVALKLNKYVDSVDVSTPIRAAMARNVLIEMNGRLRRVNLNIIGEQQLYELLEKVNKDLPHELRKAKSVRDIIRLLAIYNAYVLINLLKRST